jgi:3-oxoacyl-[acyl-carrier-protein] synthase III
MRLTRVPDHAFGLDITSGCLGTLAALNLALGWLASSGGGHAAVVSAERWSDTVDRSDSSLLPMWAHGDAGGAIIVGTDVPGRSQGEFPGAVFCSRSALNGHVLIRYGGTRNPVAPSGVDASSRELGPTPGKEVSQTYREGYAEAFALLKERFGIEPGRLVCNQIGPGIVAKIAEAGGIAPDDVIVTGNDTGHLGAVDTVVGLRRLFDAGGLDRPTAIASSAAHAFGVGLLLPPGR